jgi:hypothetical protein
MNTEHTRKIIHTHGVVAAVHDLAYRVAHRLTDLMVFDGMKLTLETVDRSFLEGDRSGWGFLDRDTLLACVGAPRSLDMSEAFIEQATTRRDRCYGLLIGDELASYGWYATQPTPVTDELLLHFDPSYAYMYKGYTRTVHRGKRLHGIGMARALAALTAEGQKGLVSYVESNNFASLRSCHRLGYQDFGRLFATRTNGRYRTYATAGCEVYDFRVEPVSA